MTSPEEHRLLREMLGAFALGQLPDAERHAVRAHLDGCADCRAELSLIEPLASSLEMVDPARLDDTPLPPPGLDEAILARVRAERGPRPGTRRRWAVALAAAAFTGVVGLAVGYRMAPDPPEVPLENVAVDRTAPGISSRVDVVAHTWGMEIKLTGSGFTRGDVYRVMVFDQAGHTVNAGQFIGTGDDEIRCNLNSSVLRADATGFQVIDATNRTVLATRL